VARPQLSSLIEPHSHAPTSSTSMTLASGGAVVLHLRGEHDCSTVDALAETLAAAVARDEPRLVIDLSEVEFIDTATVRVLTRAGDVLAQQSRTMSIRSPSRAAARVLALCGASDLIERAASNAS
jgi:stage II sporulation protein AA (anti-sigma F factor antagonist)